MNVLLLLLALRSSVPEAGEGGVAPQDVRPYRLPWEEGTPWVVGQGGMSNGTHAGKWAYDIMMPQGTRVHAARGGRVAGVKHDTPDPPPGKPGFGQANWVVIDHGDGTEAQYVHIKNASAVVKAGDVVEQGQFLCLSGNTGPSPVPHLHLEMKMRGGATYEPAFEEVEGDGKLKQGMRVTSGNIPSVPQDQKDRLAVFSRAAKLAEQEGAPGLAYLAWKQFAGEKLPVVYRRQAEARERLDEILRKAEASAASGGGEAELYRAKLAYQGVPTKAFDVVKKPLGVDPLETFLRGLKAEVEGKLASARSAYKGLLAGKPDADLRKRTEARLEAVEDRLKDQIKKPAR